MDFLEMANEKRRAEVLDQKAVEVSQQFHQSQAELIEILQQMDQCKAFRHFGMPSLYAYATQRLKIAENTAYDLITIARKAKEVPALKHEIAAQTITVSKARRISSVINKENQMEWIAKAKELPQAKLDQQIAKVSPKQAVRERTTYVSEDRLQVVHGASTALMDKLKRVQDLVSRSKGKACSMEDALEAMVNEYLERHDPVKKAERAKAREEQLGENRVNPDKNSQPQNEPNTRKSIPSKVQHEVRLRDQDCCTHIDSDGLRCGSRRWVDLHHIVPKSRGGADTVANLKTLCRAHHELIHAQPQSVA